MESGETDVQTGEVTNRWREREKRGGEEDEKAIEMCCMHVPTPCEEYNNHVLQTWTNKSCIPEIVYSYILLT